MVVPGGDQEFWVTHDTPQSRSLLEGRNRLFIPYIGERDLLGVARAVPTARSVLSQQRPDAVVSTGSAVALAFLPVSRVMGIKTTFIESAAMVSGHTRTGSALAYVPGIELRTQSKLTADTKWTYAGSVFDGFTPVETNPSHEPKRLVVTVGTSRQFGYRSLLERLVEIVPEGTEVLWQTGVTDVDGLPIEATPWLPAADLEERMREADVVISHAGCGSALAALTNGKRPVLLARRADRGEFNDDHQLEIQRQLDDRGLALAADVPTLSWDDIVEAARWNVQRDTVPSPQL